jgi:cystathionine beta-lyase
MSCQFDTLIDRRNTNCKKWDGVLELFGQDNLIPMWIADMDFRPPEEVVKSVCERAAHGIYGYESRPEEYLEAVTNWLLTRHNWKVSPSWIFHSPGVVSGLALAIHAFSKPGDRVLIQCPVYPPFHSVIQDNDRIVAESPLYLEGSKFRMDFANLEKQFQSGVKLMMLCSPHNPIGRVWTREELEKLAQLAVKYEVIVLADEIWADLTFPGFKHIPLASISPEIAKQTLTFMAPSKTFNLAGFYLSNVIISNPKLQEAYCRQVKRLALNHINVFGLVASEAAYRVGHEWLNELLVYLKDNVRYVIDEMAKITSQIRIIEPEGTFLLWLDCRDLGIPAKELNSFFVDKARVAFNDGSVFGSSGRGFQRMNIGCPRIIIQEALSRIENALSNY